MNKASGGDGIPVELFQILKDDAVNFKVISFKDIIINNIKYHQDNSDLLQENEREKLSPC